MILVALEGFKRGVSADEADMNIEEVSTTVEPQFQEWLPGKTGEIRGGAIGAAKKTVSIKGELSDVPGFTLTAAATIANSTSYFGAGAMDLFMTRGTVTEARQDWWKMEAEFIGHAGVEED